MLGADKNARLNAWYDAHGDFPRLVLGRRGRDPVSHRRSIFCLDCAPDCAPDGAAIYTDNAEGEAAKCPRCKRHLRGADAFGDLDESNLVPPNRSLH